MHNRTSGRPCPAATHGDGTVSAMVAHWREGLLDALRGEPAPRQLAALDWLAREAPSQSAVTPALCMVDARLQNAIYDGDRVAALIDFEIAQIGNAKAATASGESLERRNNNGITPPTVEK
jgi:aminoglycoside phosphotransferase (APT) family kinase protein